MIIELNGIHSNSVIRLLNNVGGWAHEHRALNLHSFHVQPVQPWWKCNEIRNEIEQGVSKTRHADCTLTSSVSFTRRICSLRSWRSLKVDCAVMEYTRAKPWPFFMYKSLIAVNCSYTGENERMERPWALSWSLNTFGLIIYSAWLLLEMTCVY